MARIVLAKSFDPRGVAEDWWFLVVEDGGEMHVEHKQVRHNPFKRIRRDIKSRRYSVEQLLATTRDEPRGSLRVVLNSEAFGKHPEAQRRAQANRLVLK